MDLLKIQGFWMQELWLLRYVLPNNNCCTEHNLSFMHCILQIMVAVGSIWKAQQHWHHIILTTGGLQCNIRALYRSNTVTVRVQMRERKWERKPVCLHGYTTTSRHGGRDLAGPNKVYFTKCLNLFPVSKCVDPEREEGLPCATCTESPPLSEWSRWRQSCRSNSQHSGQK